MGAQAYKIIEQLADNITDDVIEIGSERGEGSTTYFKTFCKDKHNFYTVDLDNTVYKNAKNIVGSNAYHMTGEKFLTEKYPNLSGKISFAYLDNFDYIFPEIEGRDFVKEQIEQYKEYGIEMNNHNSELAHLKQAQLVHKHASDMCFILFDDTYIDHTGEYSGKGGMAIKWLLENGWKIMNEEEGAFKRKYERYQNYGEWKSTLKNYWFILGKINNE